MVSTTATAPTNANAAAMATDANSFVFLYVTSVSTKYLLVMQNIAELLICIAMMNIS